ncbi:MAG: TRAP transporter small permease [Clostridiales bacterium]|jgi:TRAP-type C4-dicarboxylate transport system permease small subunit|nr:TRAP transporter small permease [Clostridiales bacterium]MDR2752083.1 TRAP transporter small permease [Clostridiales bacterium]
MPQIFDKIDRFKPVFDKVYSFVLLLCKVLLVLDVLITTMAVTGRFVPFVPDPPWSEEVVLTLMTYMAVLSASLAIRRGAHIRMTAFDRYLPPKVLMSLDLLADVAVMALALIMITVGWKYARTLPGTYVSLPWLPRFWLYFPIPLAGAAMLVFQIEVFYNHIKSFFIKKEAE